MNAAPSFAGTRRFEVVRAIGRGGMGDVFEVFDRDHGVVVALKRLRATTPETRSLVAGNNPHLHAEMLAALA